MSSNEKKGDDSSHIQNHLDEEEFDRSPLLTLIRHPETIANISHALQGATDSALTVNGQQQSRRLAESVGRSINLTWKKNERGIGQIEKAEPIRWIFSSDLIRAHGNTLSPLLVPGRPPTMIFSSPAGRASNLAKEVVRAIEDVSSSNTNVRLANEEGSYSCPSVIVREGLAERNFGAREGMIYSRGQVKPTKDLVDPAERANLKSESYPTFQKRVQDEFDYLCSLLQTNSPSNLFAPHIVVITHGLWIRTALEIAFGHARQPFTQNTGIFTLALLDHSTRALSVSISGKNRFGMVCQNDTSHLIGLKRQKGGIGSMASDRRQKTLKQVWHSTEKSSPKESIETPHPTPDPRTQDLTLPQSSQKTSIDVKPHSAVTSGPSSDKKRIPLPLKKNESPSKRQKNLLQMWTSM